MSQLTTLARPFAKAAFKVAQEGTSLQQWSGSLNLLSVLVSNAKVAALLGNPAVTGEKKAAALISLCGDELPGPVANLVNLLAENKRLGLVPEIAVLFEQLKAEHERSVEVEVISAYALDSAAEEQLAAALKGRLDRDVRLSSRVDESLIGGLIVRAGDLVIDNTVRGALKKLTETMKA
jgi:F-type H+-transporting ATPase subunit delta